MALEEIFRALESEAQARCSEIRVNAQQEAELIEKQAQNRCEQLVRERLDLHSGVVAARARRIVNAAKMQARHDVAAERDVLIGQTFEEARETLRGLRERDGYQRLFDSLLREALSSAEHPSSVLVDPRDMEIAKSSLKAQALDLPAKGELTTAAGVVVLSNDDRVRHDNTVETRLARVEERARERVGELLFG